MKEYKFDNITSNTSVGKLKSLAIGLANKFREQMVYTSVTIAICTNADTAKYSWDKRYTYMSLIVNTQSDKESPEYFILKEQKELEDVLGRSISEINTEYLLAHKDIWMTDLEGASRKLSKSRANSLTPIQVDDNRVGLYGYYSDRVLICMVEIKSFEELVKYMDTFSILPDNYTVFELTELGYLTKADHVSWLGQSGTKVHAVVAYFRIDPDDSSKLTYYRLDTWCGGNPWTAQEHSPRPVYPNTTNCTCLKCKKIINKMYKDMNITREAIKGEN